MVDFRFDKIGIEIDEKLTSTSGKYMIFVGQHYNGTEECFDVGALNLHTGEMTTRHYKLRSEALEFWEDFKSEMRGDGEYEPDEKDPLTTLPPN